MNMRRYMGWIGLLGVLLVLGGGLLWLKGRAPTKEEIELAKVTGFEDPQELRRVMELMDNKPGRRFQPSDWRLMERYAGGSSKAAGGVAMVLATLDTEEEAAHAVPIAVALKAHHPADLVTQDLPQSWKENGCPNASKELQRRWRE
ncbi:hypothetical protein EON79_01025 [bacterium]|nr:MAG: hypothetical protein EON79_01025 [bacterium]